MTGGANFSSATMLLEGAQAGAGCYSTGTSSGGAITTNSATCLGASPLPIGSLSTSSSSSATTTLSSPGTSNATSAVAGSVSCGVAQLADSASATNWSGTGPDTALIFGGLAYQNGGPFSPATQAITTDGSTGWGETTTKYTDPESFTLLVRFKTTASGGIVGFSNSQNPVGSAPTNWDRMLWVDPSGKLVWGVHPSAGSELTSTSSVNTGSWVFAALEIGSTGQSLYVNGSLQASSATTTAQAYAGWWSIGYAFAGTSWADPPTSNYFNGSIAQLAIIPSQLSSAQVSTLNADTTLASYTAGVNALSPANYWPLNDTGGTPYEGSVPGVSVTGASVTSLVDSSGHANTGTAQGGVTVAASGGPLGGAAISLDGSTGWAQTTTAYANPENFSVVAWFKTTTTSGGAIIGFTDTQGSGAPTNVDRMLWVDNSGKLVWGVFAGATDVITSPSAYNDGAWHMVVAEIGAAGQQLWVDGTEVASNSSVTTAQNFTGYWHLAWGHGGSGWPDTPTSNFLAASVSEIAIVPSQLSSTQISTLYNEPTTGSYAVDLAARSPTSSWPLQQATSGLADSSGHGNTGSAQGGVTLGAVGGPLAGDAISLNGSSGWAQTTTASNPQSFSAVAWFKTSTASGGTVLGFTSSQGTTTPTFWDRLLWLDNAGKLVWGVNPTSSNAQEITSPSAYNDGAWHMVVAEIGAAGQQLWVDGTEVASNSSLTAAQNFTGYWHIGWGYETFWGDPPTSNFVAGSLSEAAIVPSQLSSTQISTLYNAGSTAAFALDLGQLSPTSYWPLQDSASNICGTAEVTVQQTVGGITTCIYPAAKGTCPAPSSTDLVGGLGVMAITAPTASAAVTITITMQERAASGTGMAGLHMLPDIAFGTAPLLTRWSAQIFYASASGQL